MFAGDRAAEFEQRQRGASYADIARRGGGIMSTVRATRAATADELFASAVQRARTLLRDGVAPWLDASDKAAMRVEFTS